MSKEETIPNLFRTDELVLSEKAIDFALKSLKAIKLKGQEVLKELLNQKQDE